MNKPLCVTLRMTDADAQLLLLALDVLRQSKLTEDCDETTHCIGRSFCFLSNMINDAILLAKHEKEMAEHQDDKEAHERMSEWCP